MNKKDYEKLRQNLINHHIKCEGNAYTSHPMFMVQKKSIVWGLDPRYSYDVEEVYDSDNCVAYEDLYSYFKDQDDEFDQEYLPRLLDILAIDLEDPADAEEYGDITSCCELWKKYEGEISIDEDYDVMESLSREGLELTKGYGKVVWEDVSMFFDRDAAEAFCDTFDYRYGKMRVYVKSGWENGQFRDIVAAMIEGKLIWEGE